MSKLATPAGNCIALSMAYNLMVRCLVTKLLVEVMIRSTPFSVKLEQENMSHVLFLSTLSQLSWVGTSNEGYKISKLY